jgi:hypothetical protein
MFFHSSHLLAAPLTRPRTFQLYLIGPGHVGEHCASTAADDLSHLRWWWLDSRSHMNLIALREMVEIVNLNTEGNELIGNLWGFHLWLEFGAEDSLSPPEAFALEPGSGHPEV